MLSTPSQFDCFDGSKSLASPSLQCSASMVVYYEGLFPGPDTEMVVVRVSDWENCRPGVAAAPKVYMRWQDVQFTAILKSGQGHAKMRDLLPQLPGRKVSVTIDDVDDTIEIVLRQDFNKELRSDWLWKKMRGDLEWPILGPSLGWT